MNPRRGAFVALLVALVVLGMVAGHAAISKATSVPAPRATTVDAVWFCPGLPPEVAAGDRVTIANTGDTGADVDVTVLPDGGDPLRQTLTVGASSVVSKPRTAFGPPGALTLEAFGGRVVVEEGVETRTTTDTGPCATQSSSTWEFAAGTTAHGVHQWLVIDDPYATDAKVDVVLRTSSGLRKPEELQGLDVARRSRAIVAVHGLVFGEDRVAVEIHAEVGRVVAAQTLVYTSAAGSAGVATSIGGPRATDHWTFPDGATFSVAQTWLAVANVGTDDTTVHVEPLLGTGRGVTPTSVAVAQDDIVWLQLGNCRSGSQCVALPDNVRFALDVRADRGIAIVAQTITHADTRGAPGVATSIGTSGPARTWLFARNRVDGVRASSIALVDQLDGAATVNVAVVHDGVVDHPRALQGITVPGGGMVAVALPAKTDAGLVVESTVPISVERTIVGPADVARSPGVPVG